MDQRESKMTASIILDQNNVPISGEILGRTDPLRATAEQNPHAHQRPLWSAGD